MGQKVYDKMFLHISFYVPKRSFNACNDSRAFSLEAPVHKLACNEDRSAVFMIAVKNGLTVSVHKLTFSKRYRQLLNPFQFVTTLQSFVLELALFTSILPAQKTDTTAMTIIQAMSTVKTVLSLTTVVDAILHPFST